MTFQKAALAALMLVVVASSASAQSTSAQAEQLFRDGKALMKEKKFAEACAAFDASQKLEADITTLMNLADCYEKNGQIASAWGSFLSVERQTRNDSSKAGINTSAKDRATKLEKRLSYLTVSVPDESRIEGLELTRNGETVDEGTWNRAIPLDGGDYTIGGKAPGHEEWSTSVHLENENGRASVDVPKFKEAPKLVEPPPDDHIVKDDSPDVIIMTDRPSPLTGKRKIALGVAGVGVLAAGGGILLGLQAMGFESDARELCPDNPCGANADAANEVKSKAESRAMFANIAYGVAGAAVITAAVLWLTGGPEGKTEVKLHDGTGLAPVASSTSIGLAVVRRF